MRDHPVQLLDRRTQRSLSEWNRRVKAGNFANESALTAWLDGEVVSGYPRTLLIVERFGSPEYALASGAELVDAQ